MHTPSLPLSAAAQLPLGRRPKGKTLLTAEWLLGWRNGGHCLLHNGEIVFEPIRSSMSVRLLQAKWPAASTLARH